MFENDNALVQDLVNENDDFRNLYATHAELKKKIFKAEIGARPIEDLALIALKKEKLHAKDELARMLESYRKDNAAAA